MYLVSHGHSFLDAMLWPVAMCIGQTTTIFLAGGIGKSIQLLKVLSDVLPKMLPKEVLKIVTQVTKNVNGTLINVIQCLIT